ncbi:hypothetical protein [Actinacidiphila sp. bgisy167]
MLAIIDKAQLGLRLESAGFGFLLREDVLDGYRRGSARADRAPGGHHRP